MGRSGPDLPGALRTPGPEAQARLELFAKRKSGEHRLADPDGVLIDIGEDRGGTRPGRAYNPAGRS